MGADRLCKVCQRAGETVDPVNDDHIDFAGPYIVQKPLEGWPVSIATGEAAVVVFG